jgi:replicative DNA helicase
MMYGGESHADNIALLWREETYLGAKPPEPPARLKAETKAEMSAEWWKKKEALANKAEVILAKRRFGQVGAVMLDFDGPRTRFGIVRDGSTRDMWQPPPADSVMPEWVTE